MDRAASGVAYLSSVVTVVSAWGVNEWGVLFGMAVGLLTFLYNKRHKDLMLKADREYKAEMLEILRQKNQIILESSPVEEE